MINNLTHFDWIGLEGVTHMTGAGESKEAVMGSIEWAESSNLFC